MTGHRGHLEAALDHYNAEFRRRYRLGPLRAVPDGLELDAATGLTDPECAAIARWVVQHTPRFRWGTAESIGILTDDPEWRPDGELVLIVDPRGGADNWRALSAFFRDLANESREVYVVSLATVEHPDRNAPLPGPIPLDEVLASEPLAEVAFIYEVSPDTIRRWRDRHRSDQKRRRRGRPPRE